MVAVVTQLVHLPYATILIKSKKDSALMTGIMSGPEGRFALAGIPKGNYVVTISFVGFKSIEYDLVVGDLNTVFDLGKILLSPQSENLGDVIISAQKGNCFGRPRKKIVRSQREHFTTNGFSP